MAYRRVDRVSQMVHQELAQMIREDLRDPRVGPVSITDVWMSRDLGVVRASVSPLGGVGDPERMMEALERAAGRMQGELARRLRLRVAPKLEFALDDHTDEAVRMTSLLSELERKRAEQAPVEEE